MMAMKAYFQNEMTGRRFEILDFNTVEGTVTMRGSHATITEPYDKDRFKKMGYKLVKEDVPDEETVDDDE